MNTTIPADLRFRKRVLAAVALMWLAGAVFLYLFHDFTRELQVLSMTAPHVALEKMNAIRAVMRAATLFSATGLAVWLGYVAFSVYRTGQWPVPGWRVMYPMTVRSGRQASMVALFFCLLALAALVYGAVLVSFSEPIPEEEMTVPMEGA